MWIVEGCWDDAFITAAGHNDSKRGWHKVVLYEDDVYLCPTSGVWKSRTNPVQNRFITIEEAIEAWRRDSWHPAISIRFRNLITKETIPSEIL